MRGYLQCSWWRHQTETFSALLALCEGNHLWPVDSPHKDQWRGPLMISLICTRRNVWANNRDAGHLKHQRAHYDVSVMLPTYLLFHLTLTQSFDYIYNYIRSYPCNIEDIPWISLAHRLRFVVLCLVYQLICPHPSGLLHWHWGNHTIAPVPVKWPWKVWANASDGFPENDI